MPLRLGRLVKPSDPVWERVRPVVWAGLARPAASMPGLGHRSAMICDADHTLPHPAARALPCARPRR